MFLDWLADELNDAGLTVVEHSGWQTRTMQPESNFHPVGLLNHHTAGASILYNYPDPPYWPDSRLDDVCNLTIRPDGTVAVLNAGLAWDSGMGAPEILEAVRNDRPLPLLTGLTSTVSGNPWFIDIEVQHLGDGTPIHPPQYEALIQANAVICQHMNWNPLTRLIGHREWAPDRKIDPRWDGYSNPMPGIRQATLTAMEGYDMTQEQLEFLTAMADALLAADARPTSLKYVLDEYRERARITNTPGNQPEQLANATLGYTAVNDELTVGVDDLARDFAAHVADVQSSTPHS